jgi:YidC/Oxa1 family membrane protein insertase
MMEKRVIWAIALSALVFLVFSFYQQKYMPVQRPVQPATQTPAREKPEQPQTNAPKAAETPAAQTPSLSSAEDTKASAQTIEVSGNLYRAVLDNRGAVLTKWTLKDYQYKEKDKSVDFEMVAGGRSGDSTTYPASLIFAEDAITKQANNDPYKVSIEGESGNGPYAPPVTVMMTLQRGDLKIEKRFRFDKSNYLVELSIKCEKGGKPLDGRFFLGEDLGPEQEHFTSSSKLQAVYYSNGKTKRESPPKDEKEVKKIYGDEGWVGLDMQYFAIIAIPDRPFSYFDIQKHAIKGHGLDGKEVDRELIRITTPISGSLQYQVYLGPKRQSNLNAASAPELSSAIDYGYFQILVKPLLASLRWINRYVNNYGLGIVILTLLLSLLLFPFRLKQIISMKKMQAVQPKMKAIQEKYRRYKKTDPKRAEMNQEIMALYKEHGVNPLGGCLPLLMQMPLLWAFYSLLQNSIELRQAPFFWWIHDLSVKDPIYILPIVMCITMFISQKMTPMAPGTDPTQAKVMMFMPLIFGFVFKELSSGLNLYFLCSNIFQIAFQKIAERWMGKFPRLSMKTN